MPANEAVSPLRIQKTPSHSPAKASSRPLSEIGSTERRRNSPSFDQTTKRVLLSKETSPHSSSPFPNSPRLFWKEQTVSPHARFDPENENDDSLLSLSPKRNSIENLKKQSRVKNSSMFAREQKLEYDPTAIQPLDRPLAAGRPLSTSIQGNAYAGNSLAGLRHTGSSSPHSPHRRGESLTQIPALSSVKTSPAKLPTQSSFGSPFTSPTRDQPSPSGGRASPTKSSLVSNGRFNSPQYNPDSSVLSSDDDMKHQTPRALRRHAKSVTFDAAPPTITEYELVTPDPSAASGSRDGSYESDEEEDMSFDQDDSFDASLEDTEKTPVVLPEDWRHMSPDAANSSLTDLYDDVFEHGESSPRTGARPTGQTNGSRHGSIASEGESRPLPPLPGMQSQDRQRRESASGLSATAERNSDARRSLPQLPPMSGFSKSDLLTMREREVSMSLEDRLRLMHCDDDRDTHTPTQERHDNHIDEDANDHKAEAGDEADTTIGAPLAPRISRESILRRVKSRNFEEGEDHDDSYGYDLESSPERSYGDLADLDPDVPIPSREASSNFDDLPQSSTVPASEADSLIESYKLNEGEDVDGSQISAYDEYDGEELERESSVIRHPIKQESEEPELPEESETSQYSLQPEEQEEQEEQPTFQSTINSSGPPTPTVVATSPPPAEEKKDTQAQNEMYASFDGKEMDLTLDPLKASFTTAPSPLDTAPKFDAMREFLQRPLTPDENEGEENAEEDDEDPGSPGSVIRHPIEISPPDLDSEPEVPQREATIRGAGGKLKTRPSLIPEEVDMTATRRQVSGTYPPPVPERSPKRESVNLDWDQVDEEDSQLSLATKERRMLDLNLGEDSNDLSFGLDNEFDKIIESQKKGYFMRENKKVVVASSRQFSDEKAAADKPKSAARKESAERKQAWTTEPWNGKPRRKSLRTASGARRARTSGVAPPLPGQESAVNANLGAVAEQGNEEFAPGQDRGRLFVKVVGVKDLDLPLPRHERTYFQLTLDNGTHCVTTSWLDMARSTPIGQEFELTVQDEPLEFQFTLQTKLEPPRQQPSQLPTAAAAPVIQKKSSGSTFRNLLVSPKKRKDKERKAQEEADRLALQRQQEAQAAAKRNQKATAWDLLHDLVGQDGSFARAYVCLNNYEDAAYGRPLIVDIPCFNEWAVDDSGVSSVKSKRGGVVRRPPYRVGKLEIQLLYVPMPKGAGGDDMPKSMNACIRELKEAEEVKDKTWEGLLSQQGGDCPFWRRRFFRLNGTKLTAYHESTRQPRATINLAKATKLLDDKSALKQPSATKSGGRRKSGFAEDEEGYMFVEEGFRIRFANGEVIDFYADNREQKEGWMKVLSECVGKDIASGKAWTHMVLEKERRDKASRSQGAPKPLQENANGNRRPSHGRTQSHEVYSKSTPTSPVKPTHARTQSHAPTPPPKERDSRLAPAPAPRPRPQTQMVEPSKPGRREQVRSMIF